MKLFALLACLLVQEQEKDDFEKLCEAYAEKYKDEKGYIAKVEVRTIGKIQDSSSASDGKMYWKASKDEEEPPLLLWEEKDRFDRRGKPVRTLFMGSEVTVLDQKARRAVVYDLERTKKFFPAWLLRTGPVEEWRKKFDVKIIERPAESELPKGLFGKEDDEDAPVPVPPKAVGGIRGGGMIMEDVEPHRGRFLVLRLTPLDRTLRREMEAVVVRIDHKTLRICRITIDTYAREFVIFIRNFKERPLLDDSIFELDLEGVKVEKE